MGLFSILTRTSVFKVFVSLTLGTVAGVIYAFLIPLVTASLGSDSSLPEISQANHTFLSLEVSNYGFAFIFLVACLSIFVARTVSQVLLTWVIIDATSKLRIEYFHKILKAPLAKLENVGPSRLIASITTDVRTIVNGASRLPEVIISIVTILGLLIFLLYLNADLFYFVMGAFAFGVITFQIIALIGSKFFNQARESADELQEAVKGNIEGVKELKLSVDKRQGYLDNVLLKVEKDLRTANKKGATILRMAINYGDMVSLFVIGYVSFIFVNYHAISSNEILATVMVLLYITGPVSVLMNAIPEILLANISLKKVDRLFTDLPFEDINEEIVKFPDWTKLKCVDLSFQYEREDQKFIKNGTEVSVQHDLETFTVGPMSFEVVKGEVTFIVGGNGSGKSTLSKLLTGHYIAQQGSIYLGDQLLKRSEYNGYRNLVSSIYTDYYLFDQLLGVSEGSDRGALDEYLELFILTDKVSIEENRFSTLALSDGQRKRLALLVSLLEDKEIYLFDEWAADQDPIFKEVFYRRILPDLKSMNKAIIVISHDDRYFDVADKILTLEDGNLI